MTSRYGFKKFPVSSLISFFVSTGAALGLAVGQASAQATDLVCSACVQATDLAPNAVNNSKIGNGAVNAAKLAANAVTVAKIANNSITTAKISTAAVTAVKIGPNAVNTAKIANAAVTAAKIAGGAVNANKIADGAVSSAKIQNAAITGAKLADATVTADKIGILNTVFVEAAGPSDTDNCNALIAALAGATGPAAVFLGPGTYDCQAQQVIVPAGVALTGSGQTVTSIVGSVGTVTTEALVEVGDGGELSHLSVTNAGTTLRFLALNIGADVLVSNVAASASGDGAFTIALFGAGTTGCGNSVLRNIRAIAIGTGNQVRGIDLSCIGGGHLRGFNVIGMASGGANVQGLSFSSGDLTFYNSFFEGTSNSAFSTGTLRMVSSELDGPISSGVLCTNSFDQNGDPLPDGDGCT